MNLGFHLIASLLLGAGLAAFAAGGPAGGEEYLSNQIKYECSFENLSRFEHENKFLNDFFFSDVTAFDQTVYPAFARSRNHPSGWLKARSVDFYRGRGGQTEADASEMVARTLWSIAAQYPFRAESELAAPVPLQYSLVGKRFFEARRVFEHLSFSLSMAVSMEKYMLEFDEMSQALDVLQRNCALPSAIVDIFNRHMPGLRKAGGKRRDIKTKLMGRLFGEVKAAWSRMADGQSVLQSTASGLLRQAVGETKSKLRASAISASLAEIWIREFLGTKAGEGKLRETFVYSGYAGVRRSFPDSLGTQILEDQKRRPDDGLIQSFVGFRLVEFKKIAARLFMAGNELDIQKILNGFKLTQARSPVEQILMPSGDFSRYPPLHFSYKNFWADYKDRAFFDRWGLIRYLGEEARGPLPSGLVLPTEEDFRTSIGNPDGPRITWHQLVAKNLGYQGQVDFNWLVLENAPELPPHDLSPLSVTDEESMVLSWFMTLNQSFLKTELEYIDKTREEKGSGWTWVTRAHNDPIYATLERLSASAWIKTDMLSADIPLVVPSATADFAKRITLMGIQNAGDEKSLLIEIDGQRTYVLPWTPARGIDR